MATVIHDGKSHCRLKSC